MTFVPHFPRNARPLRWTAAVAVIAAVCAMLPATAARAVDSTTCTGSTSVGYDPGLTLTPQTVTVSETDTVPSCTSTDPTITSVVTSPYSYPASGAACNSIDLTPGASLRIHWNNGQHSDITGLTYEETDTGGIDQTVGTGTVTAGEFTGDAAVITWIYALVNPLLCLAPGGLTSQSGSIVAEVTG